MASVEIEEGGGQLAGALGWEETLASSREGCGQAEWVGLYPVCWQVNAGARGSE